MVSGAHKDSTLTGWFKCNAADPVGRHLCYSDFPTQYAWNNQHRRWHKRARVTDRVLGRIHGVVPGTDNPERFYLYLLLLHARGSVSFQDVRTVGGHACNTFREAAIRPPRACRA